MVVFHRNVFYEKYWAQAACLYKLSHPNSRFSFSLLDIAGGSYSGGVGWRVQKKKKRFILFMIWTIFIIFFSYPKYLFVSTYFGLTHLPHQHASAKCLTFSGPPYLKSYPSWTLFTIVLLCYIVDKLWLQCLFIQIQDCCSPTLLDFC